MFRWQEQVELKLADMMRTIRSFNKLKAIWTQLASSQPNSLPGHAAYARRQAVMFDRLAHDGRRRLVEAGYGGLLTMGGTLVDFVVERHAKEHAFLMNALRSKSSINHLTRFFMDKCMQNLK